MHSIHSAAGVDISKVTHGGRMFFAWICRSFGGSEDGVMKLGLWSNAQAFRKVYDTVLPLDALVAAAQFHASRPAAYFIPRDQFGEFSLPRLRRIAP